MTILNVPRVTNSIVLKYDFIMGKYGKICCFDSTDRDSFLFISFILLLSFQFNICNERRILARTILVKHYVGS